MAATEKEYTRLPGRGVRTDGIIAGGRVFTTLWLAKDHLLYVENSGGYTENYKRFYFRDIQAILIEKTKSGFIVNSLLGFFGILCALSALVPKDTAFVVMWLVFAAFFGAIVLFNTLSGATCKCTLQTAVQTVALSSLSRLPRAIKVLKRIQPHILEVQGELTPEQADAEFQAMMNAPASAGAAVSAQTARPVSTSSANTPPVIISSTPAPPYLGSVHRFLFYVLLGDGFMKALFLIFQAPGLRTLDVLVALTVIGAGVIALIKQHGSALSAKLKRLSWGIAIGYGGCTIAAAFFTLYSEITGTGFLLHDESIWENGFRASLCILFILLNFFTSWVGILWLREFRASQQAPPLPETA